MKILTKIKSLFKKSTNLVLEEIEIHKEYKKLKHEILKSQSLTELKNICKQHNLINSEIYYDHIDKHLDLDQIIEYCKNKKIDISKTLKKKEILDKKYIKHTLIPNKLENSKLEVEINPKIDISFNLKNK
jgi:hypothetical protein